jgi:hypothetical protein
MLTDFATGAVLVGAGRLVETGVSATGNGKVQEATRIMNRKGSAKGKADAARKLAAVKQELEDSAKAAGDHAHDRLDFLNTLRDKNKDMKKTRWSKK